MVEPIPEVTKQGRQKFVSQFSMGQYDFERYNEIFKKADESGIQLWLGNNNAIKPFYAALYQFHIQIKNFALDKELLESLSVVIEKDIKTVDGLAGQGSEYSQVIPRLKKNIKLWADKLYDIKQKIGLGIELNKIMSEKQKWSRAMRIT